MWWETGPDGCRYWKLRRGDANGLISWSLEEASGGSFFERICYRDAGGPPWIDPAQRPRSAWRRWDG